MIEDHPRRCGENTDHPEYFSPHGGSPPQVRGKLPSYLTCLSLNRITPAGAGKTFKNRRQTTVLKDHPRRCGENPTTKRAYRRTPGSPPQVRGKPSGIKSNRPFPWDHPRRCGENSNLFQRRTLQPGSPPQVRGKPVLPNSTKTEIRITPAGAGKTG